VSGRKTPRPQVTAGPAMSAGKEDCAGPRCPEAQPRRLAGALAPASPTPLRSPRSARQSWERAASSGMLS